MASKKSFLKFVEVSDQKIKTKRFIVENTSGERLGYIQWMNGWRRYVFATPIAGTIFDAGCLKEITDKLDDLMEEHKKSLMCICGVKTSKQCLNSCDKLNVVATTLTSPKTLVVLFWRRFLMLRLPNVTGEQLDVFEMTLMSLLGRNFNSRIMVKIDYDCDSYLSQAFAAIGIKGGLYGHHVFTLIQGKMAWVKQTRNAGEYDELTRVYINNMK